MLAVKSRRSAGADGLNDYLRLIKRIPLLAPDEELHLAGIVQDWLNHASPPKALLRSGVRAKCRMVSANLRLVVMISLRYKDRIGSLQLEMLDLLQAGNLGLIRAVELFHPTCGYKFSTYAFWWIRQGITNAMNECGGGIRIPKSMLKLAFRAELLQASSDQVHSTRVVADHLGESEKRLENSIQVARECQTTSLDKSFVAMNEGTNLIDLIRDEQVLTPEDDYKWLHDQVQALDSRERHLLHLRYGEDNNSSYTEVAGCMGMSKECAQSLERRALRKLRRRLTPVLNPCVS